MMPVRCPAVVALLAAVGVVACGGPQTPPPSTERPGPGPAWLRSLHASDLTRALSGRGLSCAPPRQERDTTHWACAVATPLTGYSVDFYGKAPGRLEYIRAVVTQSSQPTPARALDLLAYVAGLGYDGADPPSARAWLEDHLESGGQTAVGPATFKASGDLSRLVLEIKAPGSEW